MSNRNFPLSGQAAKEPGGVFHSNWALAWVIGSVILVVALILALFALGIL